MILHRYTISALGHLAGSSEQNCAALPRSAVEDAGRLLDRHGNKFQARVPLKGFGHVELRWKSDDFSCALATFTAEDDMLSTDVILSGLRPDADRMLQQSAQAMVRQVCQSGGEQAAEGIYHADKRPAVACIRWSAKEGKGMAQVMDLEVCLATAFLERAFDTVKLVF
jgi:hypothetical protein